MHKNATKCNKTQSKWCINKNGASKIIDTFDTYQCCPVHMLSWVSRCWLRGVQICLRCYECCFGYFWHDVASDKKDESRFLERFLLSECSRLSTREPCLLCLPLFVCDVLVRASWKALLAALTDSCIFLIALFLFLAALTPDVEHNDILRVPISSLLLGWLRRHRPML
jgi:hypothetical protein